MGEVLRSKIGVPTFSSTRLMLLLRAGCEIYSFLAAAEKLRACQTQAVDTLNRHWGPKSAQLHFTEQYRNMKEKLAEHPQLVELARSACLAAGITPRMAALTALALLSAGCPAPIWGLAAGDTTARMSISPCRLWKSKRHSARADFSVWPDRFDLSGFSL